MSFPDPRVLATLVLWCLAGVMRAQTVEVSEFGRTATGESVEQFELTNSAGIKVRVMNWGATLLGIETPDREGKLANITLHLDTFAEYEAGHPLFGSVVGRYANRIAGGGFTIDGVRHDLKTVNAKTGVHIHGGKEGLASRLWEAKPYRLKGESGVEFTHTSPDGHEGFPGEVSLSVTYRLWNGGPLEIEYHGTSTKPTHLNLTNHAYFNLGGADSGDVLGHRLTLWSDQRLEFDANKIPTGKLLEVKGTPFDFREPRTIGSRIAEVEGGGYDHCYVLAARSPAREPARFARLEDPRSGRVMEVLTTQPGVQLYTANYLKPPFVPHQGVCLETQHYPDSPNRPEFPSTLVRPGETYREVTEFRFSVME